MEQHTKTWVIITPIRFIVEFCNIFWK